MSTEEEEESFAKFKISVDKIKAKEGKDASLFDLDGEFGSFLVKFRKKMRDLTREGRAKMVEPMHEMGVTKLIFKAVEHFMKQESQREVLVYSKVLMDWTDCCENVCQSLIDEGKAIPFYLSQMERCHEENANLHENEGDLCYMAEACSPLLSSYLSLLYNISKYSESWPEEQRKYGAEVAEIFLAYCKDDIQMTALCMLASLLSDGKDSVALADKFDVIPKLIDGLEKALKNEKEHLHVMYAEEFAEALSHLAINDDNKKAIAKPKVLKLLVEMMSEGDEVEQEEAVDCLWALAFDDSIRLEIKKQEGWEVAMKKIEDGAKNPELKRKATMASDFIIAGKPVSGTKISEEKSDQRNVGDADDDGHIFISYNKEHRKTVLEIQKFLLDKGFKVWMDVDKMTNNTLEAMASGLEQAKLVLICYSEHYKHSNMCRTEAEYVFELGKPFIPINMEYKYKPTGWLGIIIGARLYVDFSLYKYPLNGRFGLLMKEMGTLLEKGKGNGLSTNQTNENQRSNDNPTMAATRRDVTHAYYLCPGCDSEMVFIPHESDSHPFSNTIGINIKEWSKDDVANWVSSEGFSKNVLQNFNGKNMIELFKMKQTVSFFLNRKKGKLFFLSVGS